MRQTYGRLFAMFVDMVFQEFMMAHLLRGDTVIAWDFSGYTGEEAVGEAVVTHPFFMETDSSLLVRRGPGIQHAPNNDRFNANNWAEPDLSSAVNKGDYFEWEIVPVAGSSLSLTSLTLQIERSSTGPSHFTLRSSLNGFNTDLQTWEITTSSDVLTADLSAFQDIESRVIFRLYGYGNSSTAGSAGFEGPGKDLIVEGSLTSKVPLPETLTIHTATDSTMTLTWISPAGIPGTDWTGFYLFVSADDPNSLNVNHLDGSTLSPHHDLEHASFFEGSYCVGHIQDTVTQSLIITGMEESRTYYVTAYAYLLENGDTAWSVQAPERSLRYYAIVINEILADPATDISGDANGDGVRSASEDEFIELVNTSETTADLSSWMIGDEDGIRHIFPNGTLIPPDGMIVVFGGGAPDLPDSEAQIYLASTGTLSLNNTHESVALLTYDSTLIDSHAWLSEGGQDQSMVRNPALSGPFILHTSLSGTEPFSPGIITNYENSLPVSLAGFSGEASGYTVHLSWYTESETENAGFSILRQYDDEEPILLANFTSNPELKGHGSTPELHEYHFTDYPVKPGIYTYWLTDHSFSGENTTHFHKRIHIPYGLTIHPYPNPFNTSFQVPMRLAERQRISLSIVNLLGQTILEKEYTFNAGNHEIPVNMERFQAGIYFLRVKTRNSCTVKKLIYLK